MINHITNGPRQNGKQYNLNLDNGGLHSHWAIHCPSGLP